MRNVLISLTHTTVSCMVPERTRSCARKNWVLCQKKLLVPERTRSGMIPERTDSCATNNWVHPRIKTGLVWSQKEVGPFPERARPGPRKTGVGPRKNQSSLVPGRTGSGMVPERTNQTAAKISWKRGICWVDLQLLVRSIGHVSNSVSLWAT